MSELKQAVLVEGTQLRARGSVYETGVSASNVAPLAEPRFATAAANSAEQSTSIAVASGQRSLERASAGQPGCDCKLHHAGVASSAALGLKAAYPLPLADDYPGSAEQPAGFCLLGASASAAQELHLAHQNQTACSASSAAQHAATPAAVEPPRLRLLMLM